MHPYVFQLWSLVAVFATLGAVLTNAPEAFTPEQRFAILVAYTMVGQVLAVILYQPQRRKAHRLRARYLSESAQLFSGIPPVELVSFLLSKSTKVL
jgi:hypothetical protein